MKSNNRAFGKLGEEYAATYLSNEGYEIIGRNVYVGRDEIDIVARNDEYLIFAEVKTRRELPEAPDKFGRPATAVDYRKKAHLISSSIKYVHSYPTIKGNRRMNIDVIEIYVDPSSSDFRVIKINHIRNAVTR